MNRKKQKELVAMKGEMMDMLRRQNYLVDRLTNGEEEFLDMLEEFYDISVILNGLVKKEKKCAK